MTRVLVVQPDQSIAEQMAASLYGVGYDVELCGGPEQTTCPVTADLPCPLVDRADVLVYDAWVVRDTEAAHRLIDDLRELYVDLPVVLTSADESVSWVEHEGPHRVVAVPPGSGTQILVDAIELAVAEQGMAV